jgi:hypothetical protein
MTINAVTSLADLEFKAKTDPHYKQLAVLGCRRLGYFYKSYPHAIKKLHTIAQKPSAFGEVSCSRVIYEVNLCRGNIVREVKKPKKITAKKKTLSELMADKNVVKKVRTGRTVRKSAFFVSHNDDE